MTHYPWRIFFEKIIDVIFMYLLAPFIAQNSLKILRVDPEYDHAPFLDPKWPICPERDFFRKTINLILMYFFASLIMQNSKKSSEHIQSSQNMSFLETKWPCGSEEFFWKNNKYNFHNFDVHLGLFTLFVEFQKILRVCPESWPCIIFGPKMTQMVHCYNFLSN